MNTETDYLKSIAEEIAFSGNISTAKPNHHFLVEARRLETVIIYRLNGIENFTQRDIFFFTTLTKLIDICDFLFDISTADNPNVIVLVDLIASIRQVLPWDTWPNLKLSKAFLYLQAKRISAVWDEQSKILQEQKIEARLLEIAAIPFLRFIQGKQKLQWGDFTWLRGYEAKLEIIDWEDADCNSKTEALMSLLIGRNFNDDRFYIYCKKYILHRTKSAGGKSARLLEYAQCEKLVMEDTQLGTTAFDRRANSVSARLIKWIREEIDFVETHERESPFIKLHFDMYVNRIAFFFKLLHEQKVFGEASFKDLSRQIASTCLSCEGEEILAKTIISKAYPKDQKMLEEMEALLSGMLSYVRSFMRRG
jgi:hypothetical protein